MVLILLKINPQKKKTNQCFLNNINSTHQQFCSYIYYPISTIIVDRQTNYKYFFKNSPVKLFLHSAIFSGVPVATICPPKSPPLGPKSII